MEMVRTKPGRKHEKCVLAEKISIYASTIRVRGVCIMSDGHI